MIQKKRILISQVYYNESIHNLLIKYHYLVKELYIDSGGFTWYQKGFKESEDVYFLQYMNKVEKIRELQKYFKIYFIQLDKPLHFKETKELWERQKNIPNFYPVFTVGSPHSYLKELIEQNLDLIFLGGIAQKPNKWIYNYLEPSFFEDEKFSNIFKNSTSKIHMLGKLNFDFDLDYIYSMDSCIFNGEYRDPFISGVKNYYSNTELKQYVSNNLIQCFIIYLRKINRINPDKFVFATLGSSLTKVCLQAFSNEEQEVFNYIKDLFLLNKIPSTPRQQDDKQLKLFF